MAKVGTSHISSVPISGLGVDARPETPLRSLAVVQFDGHSPQDLRTLVLDGALVMLPPTPASLDFAAAARARLEEAFAPYHPMEAQHHFAVDEFAKILGATKHAFTNGEDSWERMVAVLGAYGLATEDVYADVPRMRVSTSHDFLVAGAGHQQPPHRDTWWGSPFAQLNFWGPIYPMHPAAGMDFFPGIFTRPLPNTSEDFDLDDWQRVGRPNATQETGRKDTRGVPEPVGDLAAAAFTPVLPVGGFVVFSGAQAHATKPHTTGRSRGSVDFRVLSLDDIVSGAGPANIDSACHGSAIRDFQHLVTRDRVPQDLQDLVAVVPLVSI